MFGRIAAFELRYQLGSPVFWVVAILFFLLTFGAITVDEIRIGSGGNIHANAPVAIAMIHLILSIFFMFVTTAFVANVIVRDDESGFGPMVRSTRVGKFDYLIGRFTGAFLAAAVAFLAVPVAIWLGSLMPWLDPQTLGPNRLGDYAFAYGALALPNLFLTAAIFFAVATATRSMLYSYLAVVVFLVGYFTLTGIIGSQPEWRETLAYVEPFGIGALSSTMRYWTAAESNGMTPPLEGVLLANRALVIGIGLAALAFAYARFRFAERGASKRKLRHQARADAKLARRDPIVVDRLPPVAPESARWTQLWSRCRFEMAQVLRSPAFFILLLLGLVTAGTGLWNANTLYGTPARPLTFAIIDTLFGTFGIIPIIIAIYYAGEVVWRDRDRRMHEIVDATPLPNWAYMVPKTLAVALVLFLTLLVSVLAAILIQLIRGGGAIDLGQYVGWYLVPVTLDMVLIAVLAVFLQALSPNKYLGWALMVVYLVASITLTSIGFEHPLYQYGAEPPSLSDMNGDQVGGARRWWLYLYWGAFAVMLGVLAHLLWRRGTDVPLRARVRRVPARLIGPAGVILSAAAIVFVGTGAFLYWNMNVLNIYRTQDDVDARLAAYEKKYLRYETLRQPSATAIRFAVDLYPEQRRMEARGRYALINDSDAPIETLHVRMPDLMTQLVSVTVPGARLVHDDAEMQYRIYRFARPLAPGQTTTLDFVTQREQRGVRANDADINLVANGTFLNNTQFAPQIGMNRRGLLSERTKRREYGLSDELRPAKLEDLSATARNQILDADWVTSDITVTTSADQTPIAPGRKVSDEVANGRRTSRFVSTAPILAFFSIQSAKYAQANAMAGDVRLSVFHHPKHGFNVERMLVAMQRSLAYYEDAFGPYQFDYARVIEFPGYASFAQAFAGTIPYSERIGFIADTRDPDAIDYVTYVTAHEMAHQYWGHQLVAADMQGGTMLVETLAQYSALMVMKELYGEDRIRRFLKYELDSYLNARGSEAIEELPLNRVENQPYIHYRKGSVVMYLLQDRLGEDRVNAMLADLLDRYRFKGAPYPRSTVLVDGFKGLARTPAERMLVSDLLERITVYDRKATAATTRQIAPNRFETVLTVEATKSYANGEGVEEPAPLADLIDIGVFTARPGVGAFAQDDVIAIERRPIRTGTQQIRIVTTRRPTFAGIDPYNKYVDRNSDDNLIGTDL